MSRTASPSCGGEGGPPTPEPQPRPPVKLPPLPLSPGGGDAQHLSPMAVGPAPAHPILTPRDSHLSVSERLSHTSRQSSCSGDLSRHESMGSVASMRSVTVVPLNRAACEAVKRVPSSASMQSPAATPSSYAAGRRGSLEGSPSGALHRGGLRGRERGLAAALIAGVASRENSFRHKPPPDRTPPSAPLTYEGELPAALLSRRRSSLERVAKLQHALETALCAPPPALVPSASRLPPPRGDGSDAGGGGSELNTSMSNVMVNVNASNSNSNNGSPPGPAAAVASAPSPAAPGRQGSGAGAGAHLATPRCGMLATPSTTSLLALTKRAPTSRALRRHLIQPPPGVAAAIMSPASLQLQLTPGTGTVAPQVTSPATPRSPFTKLPDSGHPSAFANNGSFAGTTASEKMADLLNMLERADEYLMARMGLGRSPVAVEVAGSDEAKALTYFGAGNAYEPGGDDTGGGIPHTPGAPLAPGTRGSGFPAVGHTFDAVGGDANASANANSNGGASSGTARNHPPPEKGGASGDVSLLVVHNRSPAVSNPNWGAEATTPGLPSGFDPFSEHSEVDDIHDPHPVREDLALRYPSLCGISGDNWLRRRVHAITRSRYFDGAVVLFILLNSLHISIEPFEEAAPWLEHVFTGIFTVEALLKIFADGFVMHPGAYLRSNWNRLDFFIVVVAWAAYIPGVANFTVIRLVRAIRPLRYINGVRGLKAIVGALFLSVQGLLHVLLLIAFYFTVFGILGVQLFGGLFRLRCVDPATGVPPGYPSDEGQFCANASHILVGRTCPAGLVCQETENPDMGYSSFDSLVWAALLIFQCITLEGWVGQMYRVQDLRGWVAFAYFYPLIIFGAFFILNLALAVISERFHWTKEIQQTLAFREKMATLLEEEILKQEREQLAFEQQQAAAALCGRALRAPHAGPPTSLGGSPVKDNRHAANGYDAYPAGDATAATAPPGVDVTDAEHKNPTSAPPGTGTGDHVVSSGTTHILPPLLLPPPSEMAARVSASPPPGNPDPSRRAGESPTGPQSQGVTSASAGVLSATTQTCTSPATTATSWNAMVVPPASATPPPNNGRVYSPVVLTLEAPPGDDHLSPVRVEASSTTSNLATPLAKPQDRPHPRVALNGAGDVPPASLSADPMAVDRRPSTPAPMPVIDVAPSLGGEVSSGKPTPSQLDVTSGMTMDTCRSHASRRATLGERSERSMSGGGMSAGGGAGPNRERRTSLAVPPDTFNLMGANSAQGAAPAALRKVSGGGESVNTNHALSEDPTASRRLSLCPSEGGGLGMRRTSRVSFAPDDADGGGTGASAPASTPATTAAGTLDRAPADIARQVLPSPPHQHQQQQHHHHPLVPGGAAVAGLPTPASTAPYNPPGFTSSHNGFSDRDAFGSEDFVQVESRHVSPRERMMDGGRIGRMIDPDGDHEGTLFEELRASTKAVAEHKCFQYFIIACISVNTIILATEHEGQSDTLTYAQYYSNLVLTGVFTGEMMVKLLGVGVRGYVRDNFNILDGVIVVVSIVELFPDDQASGVSIFRALRLLRVFKLMKSFQKLRMLIRVVLQAVLDTGYLAIVIFLYLFIAASIGHQLFGGKIQGEAHAEDPPRATFDSFYWSLLTVFQIMTRDNWTTPMWHAMAGTSDFAAIYFVVLVLVGDFVLLNLFLAILINCFDENWGQEEDDASNVYEEDLVADEESMDARIDGLVRDDLSRATLRSRVNSRVSIGASLDSRMCRAVRRESIRLSRGGFMFTESVVGGAAKALARCALDNAQPTTNGGHSLLLFGPTNPVRLWCTWFVSHHLFEKTMLVLIAASSIMLALNGTAYEADEADHPANIVDGVFTVIFAMEVVLKCVAFGVILGEGAYLRDAWNVLDAVVVAISIFTLVFANFKVVKVFRTLRALRPLRVVNRFRGLKIVVRSLLRSLPGVANVGLVVFFIFFVFSTLGVQMFRGKMSYCSDPAISWRHECIGIDPELYEINENVSLTGRLVHRRWQTNPQNFDNIFASLLTLFEVSTLELWSSIMYRTIDGVGAEHGPIRNHRPLAGVYYMLFITIGSFFVYNLFVGVVIFTYNNEKKSVEGAALISDDQQQWLDMQTFMLTFRPEPKMPKAKTGTRKWSCAIANNERFHNLVLVIIMVNTLAMAMEGQGNSADMKYALGWVDFTCSCFFILEAMVKVHAWARAYFRNSWNKFDFLLALVAAADIIVDQIIGMQSGWVRSVKLFRILRLIRLLKSSRGLRLLLETLFYSLPYISNIFLFLGLLFFIYAVLGRSLFHDVRRGEYVTYHNNFDNFPAALQVLFRCCTGEDWNGVMHDLMVQPPDCVSGEDCGPATWVPPLYFITFLLIAAQVMLNLFVAIILDNFATTIEIEKSKVGMKDLYSFITCWSEYDPTASLIIPTSALPRLLVELGPPLGLRRDSENRIELLQLLDRLRIPEHCGTIHFVEVFVPLTRYSLGVQLDDTQVLAQEDDWKEIFPDLRSLPLVYYRKRRVNVTQFFAAVYIQSCFKRAMCVRRYHMMREAKRARTLLWRRQLRLMAHTSQTDHVVTMFARMMRGHTGAADLETASEDTAGCGSPLLTLNTCNGGALMALNLATPDSLQLGGSAVAVSNGSFPGARERGLVKSPMLPSPMAVL